MEWYQKICCGTDCTSVGKHLARDGPLVGSDAALRDLGGHTTGQCCQWIAPCPWRTSAEVVQGDIDLTHREARLRLTDEARRLTCCRTATTPLWLGSWCQNRGLL